MRDATLDMVNQVTRCMEKVLFNQNDPNTEAVLRLAIASLGPGMLPEEVERICSTLEDEAAWTDDDGLIDCFTCMERTLRDVLYDLECDNEF